MSSTLITMEGYATETCLAVISHVFNQINAKILVSATAVANHLSRRLLERLGFKKIAEVDASFENDEKGSPMIFPAYFYEVIREEWQKRKLINDSG